MFLKNVPLRIPSTKKQQNIIRLVDKILAAPESPDVPTLEAEIDRLVYDLYGLTDDEIAVVEGKS